MTLHFSADYIAHSGEKTHNGHKFIKQFAKQLRTAIPDIKIVKIEVLSQAANFSNQAFYVCAGTAAVIWIYDIIWVWNKGAQNKKAQKAYKQTHLGFYYEPNFNATGLSYTVNF